MALMAVTGACAAETGGKVKELSDAGFADVVKSVKRPVVIDFSATWCGPCKMYAPTYHDVAEEYACKADFYTVDIDKSPSVAAAFGVQAVPTTVVLYGEDGKGFAQSGVIPADMLKKMVDTALDEMAKAAADEAKE